MRRLLLAVCLLVAACTEQKTTGPVYFADDDPRHLSSWGLLRIENGQLKLSEGVIPYSLNSSLFTDYAHKLRTIWIPEGNALADEKGVLGFPVGTVISKTFYYPTDGDDLLKQADTEPVNEARGLPLDEYRLIETRLLVRRENGWHAVAYVWNEEQSDAEISRLGAIEELVLVSSDTKRAPFTYVVPNANQCGSCHISDSRAKTIEPLGPKVAQINREYAYAEGPQNQLHRLISAGYLAPSTEPLAAMAVWDDPSQPIENRARAYIDVNCGHFHNPAGPADTSGLFLNIENDNPFRLGTCKPTIAAGSGTGGHRFGILPGEPENSIFVFRMESKDPAAMMPELGRSLVHEEGVALISAWIRQMGGNCG